MKLKRLLEGEKPSKVGELSEIQSKVRRLETLQKTSRQKIGRSPSLKQRSILQLPIWETSQGRTAECEYGTMHWIEALWVLLHVVLLLCLNCSLLLCMVIENVFFTDGHYPFPWLRHIHCGNLLVTWLLSWPGAVTSISLRVNLHFSCSPCVSLLHVTYDYVFCSPLPYCTCMFFTSCKGHE